MALSPVYYVGQNQIYTEVNQALASIRSDVLNTDPLGWPTELDIKVILTDNTLYLPIKIQDSTTQLLYENGKRLVITREEYTQSGDIVTDSVPKISTHGPGSDELDDEDRVIAVNIGDNNPGVTIQGLMIQDGIIGIYAGFNSNELIISRCFVLNCLNVQCYVRDLRHAYILNNLFIGGEFGLVVKHVEKARIYHNTIFLDGVQTLSDNQTVSAGVVLQAERVVNFPLTEWLTEFIHEEGEGYDRLAFFIGNLIYTVGAPALILYHDDLNEIYKLHEDIPPVGRIVSNFNCLYSDTITVQVRQDNFADDDGTQADVVFANHVTLADWQNAYFLGQLEDDYIQGIEKRIDANSIGVDPLFIEYINSNDGSMGSIINLWLLTNSPVLNQVPNLANDRTYGVGFGAWKLVFETADYYINWDPYMPLEMDTIPIAIDSLLNPRVIPNTSIGANDSVSINGFFGEDIFTGPFTIDPDKNCDVTPIHYVLEQRLNLIYPSLLAGYFWSHERPYYLYGKKGAGQLGYFTKVTFDLPGKLNLKEEITVKVFDEEISSENWNIIGNKLIVYFRDYGLKHYEDEVQLEGEFLFWDDDGFRFASTKTYYIFKVNDGIIEFCLPPNYEEGSPVVVTDDRVNYKNKDDITKSEFLVNYDLNSQQTVVEFNGSKNLFNNSEFTYSEALIAPKYWETPPYNSNDFARTFMLGDDYSYWGDNAVGLNIGYNPGTINYEPLSVDPSGYITFSWHSMVPAGIYPVTGTDSDGVLLYNTGEQINSITGHCTFKFYDSYGLFMPTDTVVNSFVSYNSYYKRYSITLGPSIELTSGQLSIESTQIEYLNDLHTVPIPERAGSVEFGISGGNYTSGSYASGVWSGAFITLDALQAERSKTLSYYSPRPDFQNTTVEFETDPSGVFIDKNLNITPAYHDDPNGFLYIHDMPASLWGGPKHAETTSLHEYRWPEGRLLYLPWARVWGKDKLEQKHVKGDVPKKSEEIIAPYVYSKFATDIVLTPSEIVASQINQSLEDNLYTVGKDFGVNIIDNIGNAYHLRNYQVSIYEENGKFPGWLSKTYFGAKEQLGDMLYGSLSANGSMNGLYTPPPSSLITYEGLTPTSGDMTTLKMPYRVASDSQGNVTVEVPIGSNGSGNTSGSTFLPTEGTDPLTGYYSVTSNGQNETPYISLDFVPKIASSRVSFESVNFNETPGEPSMREFFVDYVNASINFTKNFTGDNVYVEYIPKYVTVDSLNSNHLNFVHSKVFDDYQGPVEINYDAEIFLEVAVEQPVSGQFIETFSMTAQNYKTFENHRNNVYGEFF